MNITTANRQDLPEILALQYLAFQSQAKLLGNPDIPPLKQTLEEVEAEYDAGVLFLKAVDEDGRIVGSVRGHERDGTLHVGKLMVHPASQGTGLGKALLAEIERHSFCTRYELFTSTGSESNLRLYEKAGYTRFKEEPAGDNLCFAYLEKRA